MEASLLMRTSTDTVKPKKELKFCCDAARDELMGLPVEIRKAFGEQFRRVQWGQLPDRVEWFETVGPKVLQMGVRDAHSWYRAMYIQGYPEAIYALHFFQKKTNQTPQRNIDIARKRLSDLNAERTKGRK